MKVLEYTYKTNPETRKLVFANNVDGDKLFNDIIKSRADNVNTLMVNGQGRVLLINPCEILEIVLIETNDLENI